MPELITEGKVYRGLPPLYKVEYEDTGKNRKSKKKKYLLMILNLRRFRKKEHKILSLQRYKGLGEMDANQLWETTCDPEKRSPAQVTIQDTVEAGEVTSLLMGTDVPPRENLS